jgi:proteic killer suppression protein
MASLVLRCSSQNGSASWSVDIWDRASLVSGLEEVRKVPGYHDEPLKGSRQGQRSIRLNRAYRAIYVVVQDDVQFVSVEEVNKHEY